MGARRYRAALMPSLMLVAAAPAAAQMRAAELVGPLDAAAPATIAPAAPSAAPIFRMAEQDWRWPASTRPSGLIAAYPIDENVQVGIGRFTVAEIARPRTNVEAERHPMAVRPREGRIAAVGVSVRF